MSGRRTKPGGGATKQSEIAFDHGRHAGTAVSAPPKLFLAESSASGEASEAVVSPTSTLQAAASPTSPATTCHRTTAVPFSRGGRSSGGDRWGKSKSQSHRPWEARPVRLGLAGALNGEATEAASTVLTGQRLRPPVHTTNAPCSSSPSPAESKEFGVKNCRIPTVADRPARSSPRRRLSPREMEASEDYTRVIARGPNPRTTHIFDDRVVVDSCCEFSAGGDEDEFLRWCHGCSKDLGHGKDIFMYRGEMAFCSHECRYRAMLFHEKS
ncbi:FCS-Like Zinc finger 8-like [Phragmites australis]|uniref:FCS-Like Zinc finger 8-like n=1 Tax=Phragmites australis TaxID=29695 RepID=UPI002D7824A9|nr:FCS-Like Zinc finger 8-like [Phragmites australis]